MRERAPTARAHRARVPSAVVEENVEENGEENGEVVRAGPAATVTRARGDGDADRRRYASVSEGDRRAMRRGMWRHRAVRHIQLVVVK